MLITSRLFNGRILLSTTPLLSVQAEIRLRSFIGWSRREMAQGVPNRGPAIDAVQLSMVVSTTIAVALRFIGRRVAHVGFWWDDWALLAALVCYNKDWAVGLGCMIRIADIKEATLAWVQCGQPRRYVFAPCITNIRALLTYTNSRSKWTGQARVCHAQCRREIPP